jgi:hypothetical protein
LRNRWLTGRRQGRSGRSSATGRLSPVWSRRGVALLALLAALAFVVRARADQPTPCGPAVGAWIRQASLAIGDPIEARKCRVGGVVLRLRPLGAQPVDVDVAEPPGDGFFRAGRLRVSPMLDVPDYSEVPLAEREAVDRLVRWLASHESDITFVERTTWFSRFGASWLGPWLLVASLACAAIGISLDRRWATRREASAAGLVFGIALALRVSLGVWGPLRINGFGPIWISGAALDRSVLSAYGPGYAEVFGPLARLAPHAADTSIFGANAVLSALLAPLVYALARAFGVSTRPALLAAAVLAVDAASVRLAASESYFVVIATLVIAASIAIARSLHGFAVGARTSTLAWAFCGSFLCAQAARIHPCAWIPVACVPLATLGAEATGLRVRGRLLGLALAATLVGGVVLATSGKLIALALGEAIAWIPSTHGRELALGGVIGLALATLARPRRVALPAAVAVVGLLATRSAYAQSHDWQSGSDLLTRPMAARGKSHLSRAPTTPNV